MLTIKYKAALLAALPVLPFLLAPAEASTTSIDISSHSGNLTELPEFDCVGTKRSGLDLLDGSLASHQYVLTSQHKIISSFPLINERRIREEI